MARKPVPSSLASLSSYPRSQAADRSNGRAKASVLPELPDVSISEFDGVRYLHLGETPWVQGALRLRKPKVLELEYVQRMMAWLLLLPEARWTESPQDLHVAQLGLGAAALTRFCHGVVGTRTTVIELNPQVVGACHHWFHLPENDDRLDVMVGDAGLWIAQDDQIATLDALSIDLYDQEAAAPVLDDEVFYRHCAAALVPGGVMSVNLFGRQASFPRSARRIEAAFGAGQVRMLSPTKEGNTIVLALKGHGAVPAPGASDDATLTGVSVDAEFAWPTREVMMQRAEVVEARLGLSATKWPRLVKSVPAARPPRDAASPDDTEPDDDTGAQGSAAAQAE